MSSKQMNIINSVINSAPRLFKRLGIFGRLRFRMLYLAYILFPSIGPRHAEWKFILNYMPPLKKANGKVYTLDAGGTESLFAYELAGRGYTTTILDYRLYQERLPQHIKFIRGDLRSTPFPDKSFDYIVSISVLEHIGLGIYGDSTHNGKDKEMIKEMARILKRSGQFLVTVPNYISARDSNPPYPSYSYRDFKDLVSDYFDIQECTERRNQICAVLIKK